jgi:hypothetical protein
MNQAVKRRAYNVLFLACGLLVISGFFVRAWWDWFLIGAGLAVVAFVNLVVLRGRRADG